MRHASRNSLNLCLTLALLLGTVSLTGCGIKGDLKTPPPLWGDGSGNAGDTPDGDSVLSENPIDSDESDIFDEDYIDATSPY